MKIFFLDDDATRHKRFTMNRIGSDITQAWNYEEACRLLGEQVFDVAWLDHDLSYEATLGTQSVDEKTGTHVAEFIAAMPDDRRPRFVVLHTFNPAGRMRMLGILRAAGVGVAIEPFNG